MAEGYTYPITAILQNIFKDSGDDIAKITSDAIESSISKAPEEITNFLKNESIENISKVINHDVEYLGSKSFSDYINTTNIFKNLDDFNGVITELAKNGDFVPLKEQIKNEVAEDAANSIKKIVSPESLKKDGEFIADNISGPAKTFEQILEEAPGEIIDEATYKMAGMSDYDRAEYAKNAYIKNAEKMAQESAKAANGSSSKGTPIEDYLSKAGQRKLKTERYKAKGNYNRYSTAKKFNGMLDEFENGNFDDPRLKRIGEILGKESKELNMDEIKYLANKEISESYNRKSTLGELAGYYKVPQIGVGVFGTAWLVNKLSDDRGEQTNAQLYNQQPYNR